MLEKCTIKFTISSDAFVIILWQYTSLVYYFSFLDESTGDFGYCDEVCDLKTPIEETENGFQLKLDVPSAFFKHIIGRKAETKRRLETETRTQIRIPKPGQEGPIGIFYRNKCSCILT